MDTQKYRLYLQTYNLYRVKSAGIGFSLGGSAASLFRPFGRFAKRIFGGRPVAQGQMLQRLPVKGMPHATPVTAPNGAFNNAQVGTANMQMQPQVLPWGETMWRAVKAPFQLAYNGAKGLNRGVRSFVSGFKHELYGNPNYRPW